MPGGKFLSFLKIVSADISICCNSRAVYSSPA